jgi:hypothetical protein
MYLLPAIGLTFADTGTTKAWAKLPSLDPGALLDAHVKNVAAFTKANQVLVEGLKTMTLRECDLFKSTVDDCTHATSEILTGTSVHEKATKQVDGAGRIYASGVACLIELSDIAVKTNVSAMDILNARATEAFDELKTLFTGNGTTTAVNSATSLITAEPMAVVDEVTPIEDAVAAVRPIAPSTSTVALRTALVSQAASAPAESPKPMTKTTAPAGKAGRRRNRSN